jgi:CHASE2 domain-containing sensor protein
MEKINADLLRRSLLNKGTISVLALVSIWNLLVPLEWVKEQLPFLVTIQLRFHQLLSYPDFRETSVNRVAIAEVNDRSFYYPPFSGTQPTNRRAIADLAKKAADGGALVIAIDFQLKSPFTSPGDDAVRADDNKYLLDVLGDLARRGIPVVISCGLVRHGKDEWQREPNIFDDGALPPGVLLGYINLPIDKRQIPLQQIAWDWDGKTPKLFDSLALQTASALEQVESIFPKTRDKKSIVKAMEQSEYVYGGFLRTSAFSHTLASARDVLISNGQIEKVFLGKIAIIGGDWHQFGENRGPLIESFHSPVGDVPGLYLHANYVEALLDNRFRHAVPGWFGFGFDLAVGMMLYVFFDAVRGPTGRLGVLAVFCIPPFAAYILFANFGLYFDFVLPLTLCFMHLGYSLFRDYLRMKKSA